jgi:predicted aspartyl protease
MKVRFLVLLLILSSSCVPGNSQRNCDPNKLKKSEQSANTRETKHLFGEGCGLMLMPVRIQEQEYLFLVDTGAYATIFDATQRNLLGNPESAGKVTTAGNPVSVEIFKSPELSIGPYKLQKGSDILCMDLHSLTMADGRQISGVLGMDFLENHIIQINFDKSYFSFLQRDTIGKYFPGQRINLNFDKTGRMKINGKILDNMTAGFIIDTGNNTTGTLDNETFEQIARQKDSKVAETYVVTGAGLRKTRVMRISQITIGSYEYKDVIFGQATSNTLGLDFLSRHLVTIDFPKKILYLQKAEQFDKKDEFDMSGLALLNISNLLKVYGVMPASPAEKAGFSEGDVVIKIEGKDAAQYNMKQIDRLLQSGDGKSVSFTIERNGELKDINMILEKQI